LHSILYGITKYFYSRTTLVHAYQINTDLLCAAVWLMNLIAYLPYSKWILLSLKAAFMLAWQTILELAINFFQTAEPVKNKRVL
jgi:hypothetical protein